jgi:hypothetical protein
MCFPWVFGYSEEKVIHRKFAPEKWVCCYDYLTMWFLNLCNWFVGGIWKSLQI